MSWLRILVIAWITVPLICMAVAGLFYTRRNQRAIRARAAARRAAREVETWDMRAEFSRIVAIEFPSGPDRPYDWQVDG